MRKNSYNIYDFDSAQYALYGWEPVDKLYIAVPELVSYGGEERLVYELSEYFKDTFDVIILTGKYNKDKTYPFTQEIISANIQTNNFILKQLLMLTFFSTRFFGKFSWGIAFGFPSYYISLFNKGVIWYCNTPSKFIHETSNYTDAIPWYLDVPVNMYTHFMRMVDGIVARRIKQVIANSNNIAGKLNSYLNTEAKHIIYPGVRLPKMRKSKKTKILLTVGRLHEQKRIGLIIQAMKSLPDYTLRVVGDGPEKEKFMVTLLEEKIPNVVLVGSLSDKELSTEYDRCYATIYIPEDEDFGLVPVESNAHGKMCIGANEGGIRETIINKKTGLLIEPNPAAIADAVKQLEKINPSRHVKDCILNARRFSMDKYLNQVEVVVNGI